MLKNILYDLCQNYLASLTDKIFTTNIVTLGMSPEEHAICRWNITAAVAAVRLVWSLPRNQEVLGQKGSTQLFIYSVIP